MSIQRIMVIGCGGSGKSTLARKIHHILQLELIHLDQLYWSAGWVESPKAEWEDKVRKAAAKEKWVIDGNYRGTMDIRLPRADMVVFLDYSRWLCLYRVIKRTLLNYRQTRPDSAPGCPERFTLEFLMYVFSFNDKKRPQLLERLKKRKEGTQLVIIKNQKDYMQFLEQLQLSSSTGIITTKATE